LVGKVNPKVSIYEHGIGAFPLARYVQIFAHIIRMRNLYQVAACLQHGSR
jgi:hypothetical protein